MLRSILWSSVKRPGIVLLLQKQTFLTNSYACSDVWTSRFSSNILNKVHLEDFYNSLDQNFANKGVISAIDVDIYANSIKDSSYLDELRDLIHKLRLSADTGNTLESTHHATIRNFIDHGNMQDLIDILKDPLNYGIFLDHFTANILLDKLLNLKDYEKSAIVASQVMLQEDFSNEITCALSQYACYKYVAEYVKPSPETPPPASQKKVEEVKVRIKFLRNPYFDDHFDIVDLYQISGKTLAWNSEMKNDNLNINLEILGWLVYNKYDKLLNSCERAAKNSNFKVFKEVLEILQRESGQDNREQSDQSTIEKCFNVLSNMGLAEHSIEETLKINIENAINKRQNKDITYLEQLMKVWVTDREEKLMEQTNRLDRAKRVQLIEEKHKQMESEEQKLWFFENEEQIELEIESKEKEVQQNINKNKALQKNSDLEYVPPEIVKQRR